MSIKHFFDELGKGLKHPAYLLYSEDPYLLKEAMFAARHTVAEAERDFLFHAFDMDSPDAVPPFEQVLDVLYTVPFFAGGRKIVAVEGAQKIDAAGIKALSGYLANPSPDSALLILYAGKLKKAVKDLKGTRPITLDIRERDLPYWVREKAAQKGLKLTQEAVDYLIGAVGTDAGLLSSEVEKLTLCGKKTLGRDDITALVRGSGDYDAFDLTDALRAGDADRVFRVYRVLSETQEPYALLGALNWHYGKTGGSEVEKARVFGLLNEADTLVKSAGKAFPMEYLLTRLLRL
jgi:DNA polymerase-3 subunit delta